MGQIGSLGWYRFRATLRVRWRGYVMLALIIGWLGGLALGSLAAARRTQSSFPAYLASTNPSDLGLAITVYDPASGSPGYDPSVVREIAHLPHVRHVESWVGLNILPLDASGLPKGGGGVGGGSGSVDGLYFDQDRFTIAEGRMADPTKADEFETSADAAASSGWHVGETVSFGIYTNAQTNEAGFGTSKVVPYRRVRAKLVGLAKGSGDVVVDDVDASGGGSGGAQFTPALTRPLLSCCVPVSGVGLQLDRGSRDVAAVEQEIDRAAPPGAVPTYTVASIIETKAERAVRPESIALAVFGAIVALALLLIAGPVIGRQLRRDGNDLHVLRALGAGPTMTASDGLIGVTAAILSGSVLAMLIAVALSPLAPLGPARAVYPHPGVAFDWTVLGFGTLALMLGLLATAITIAYRRSPHRLARRARRTRTGSSLARATARWGLPAPTVTGIHFAFAPNTEHDTLPARTAILATTVAVAVVAATLTFGTSLNHLVSHPALYGWNWTYELSAGSGNGDIPQRQVTQLLDHDHDVSAWTGVYFAALQLDGQPVPVIGTTPRAAVAPPTLSGHGLDGSDQVVLGANTLAQLHKRIGDTIEVSGGSRKTIRLRIVGTATMPTIGVTGDSHPTMGTGALLSDDLIAAQARNPFSDPVTGPNNILVRLRDPANAVTARRALEQIARATSTNANFGVRVVDVQRPAEIVNYRSDRSTPLILGAALAAGVVVALSLILISSVRQRRHELALLKTIGFTRSQLSATIAWQATVSVAIGTAIGIPLGLVVGRWSWDLFARTIDTVPQPTVPVAAIALVAIGALLLANLAATFPARQAARTSTALLLRDD